MTRKEFIEYCAVSLGLFGLLPLFQACAGFDPKIDYLGVPPEEFDIKGFDSWYRRNKEYSRCNPNLKYPHGCGNWGTFYKNVHSFDVTAGVCYFVHIGEIMVACAPGIVKYTYDLSSTGRAGGLMVRLDHNPYTTYYAHLSKVYVKDGQKLNRGAPIGKLLEHHRYAKLTLGHVEDPDNYGIGHTYMDYAANVDIIDAEPNLKPDYSKLIKQSKIAYSLEEKLIYREELKLTKRFHGSKTRRSSAPWSHVDVFKYLESLYSINPSLFLDFSQSGFTAMKTEFYKNQPIILTLPWVKGGMIKNKLG